MGRNTTFFAPSCKTGYNKKVSKGISPFKAPNDVAERKKWALRIPRKDRHLQQNDVLCEKYFHPVT